MIKSVCLAKSEQIVFASSSEAFYLTPNGNVLLVKKKSKLYFPYTTNLYELISTWCDFGLIYH